MDTLKSHLSDCLRCRKTHLSLDHVAHVWIMWCNSHVMSLAFAWRHEASQLLADTPGLFMTWRHGLVKQSSRNHCWRLDRLSVSISHVMYSNWCLGDDVAFRGKKASSFDDATPSGLAWRRSTLLDSLATPQATCCPRQLHPGNYISGRPASWSCDTRVHIKFRLF